MQVQNSLNRLFYIIIIGCWFFTTRICVAKASAQVLPTPGAGIRISVLTCGTGAELYTLFGHSAIRVVDSTRGIDWVFNYGTFDFSDPHFYWKFMRGQLLYFLSVEEFSDFYAEYVSDHRSIREQVLALPPTLKQQLEEALFINAQPQNRFYRYDFIFDNCTTRIRDLLQRVLGGSLQWHLRKSETISFRQSLHPYLSDLPWIELGINLLLGARADQLIRGRELMFLPDSLEWALSRASFAGKPLVSETITIYQPHVFSPPPAPISPWWAMSVLGLLLILYSWRANLFGKNFVLWVDQIIFFLLGLIGIFLAFMWWGTDHSMTKNNDQLIWASPLYVPFAIWLRSKKKFIGLFAGLMALCTAAFLVVGWWLPQKPIPVLIPFLIGIFMRLMAIYAQRKPYRFLAN
ncbi:MAG: DUF4105 domain-containing protein [Thermoflavifilum sp.]|nr:DUF4105 domain-containing protein [Thermoflavifilum sp.]